jgi:nucleoid-associated protein YgaU
MALFTRQTLIVDDSIRGKINIIATDRGAAQKIRNAIKNKQIEFAIHKVQDGERLDIIAGRMYGDSGQWRVIAAANGIGWPLQIEPGSEIFVPTNLSQVYSLF